jgi:peroxiredoxin
VFRPRRRTVVTVAAAFAVLLGGVLAVTLATGNSGGDGKVVKGNTVSYTAGKRPLAPEVTAKTLTGATIKLSSYRGKVVVLNFWGSWCPPCRDEGPTLAVLDQQYQAKGVAFIGDDVADTPANALAFTHKVGITYPSINDPGYAVVQDFSKVAPVSDTPMTVVIDKTGHVAGTILGAVTYGQMTTLLNEAGAS